MNFVHRCSTPLHKQDEVDHHTLQITWILVKIHKKDIKARLEVSLVYCHVEKNRHKTREIRKTL